MYQKPLWDARGFCCFCLPPYGIDSPWYECHFSRHAARSRSIQVDSATTRGMTNNFIFQLFKYSARHCERSEAIQKCRQRKGWIATPPAEARNDEIFVFKRFFCFSH
jgi:hypothetical protein